MTATVYPWPALLKPAAVRFDARGQTVVGPRTLTGRQQVNQVDAGGGFWAATITLALLSEGAAINAARSLRAQLKGGAAIVLVPATDAGQAAWPTAGTWSQAVNTYDDGQTFDDGYGFHNPLIRIALASDAALRATQISVTVTAAGTIGAGMMFSIGGRLHVIEEVVSVSGSSQTWKIWPALREPLFSGRDLKCDRPECRMRLADETAFDVPIGPGFFHSPGVEIRFIEAIG